MSALVAAAKNLTSLQKNGIERARDSRKMSKLWKNAVIKAFPETSISKQGENKL